MDLVRKYDFTLKLDQVISHNDLKEKNSELRCHTKEGNVI